jgi:hypothetical protein
MDRRPEIKDYPLWKLEKIAASVLDAADSCISGYRVDIDLQEHVIISDDGYYSYRRNGYFNVE